MRVNSIQKKWPRANVLRIFEVFHHTRVLDQISSPSDLSVINEGLFIKLLGCHCCCFMINNKNHNKW